MGDFIGIDGMNQLADETNREPDCDTHMNCTCEEYQCPCHETLERIRSALIGCEDAEDMVKWLGELLNVRV